MSNHRVANPASRFGEKLRYLRIRDGMTLKRLADKFGHSDHSFLSKVENGKKSPSIEFVLLAAKIFGTTTDALLRDEIEIDS